MGGIDRRRVRRAFDVHAREYDTHALIQHRVVRRCAELLQQEHLSPQRILDVGAGTGRLLSLLQVLYPDAALVGVDMAFSMGVIAREQLQESTFVTGDGEQLPFASESFDLVVSTSTFQWLETLEHAFSEVRRVLRPGGSFFFTLFGEQTLFELRDAYCRVCTALGRGGETATHTFHAADRVAAYLAAAGFRNCRVNPEREVETHGDVPSLLRSLKRIGAGNAAAGPPRGLASRSLMMAMMEVYRREHEKGGRIPATYEVIYGAGTKG